jgi:hypothetical protein
MNISKRYILLITIVIAFNFICCSQSVEYHIKASLIEKFIEYTEWEPNSINGDFVICILGESPFNGELEEIASNSKFKGKPVKIIYSRNIDEIKNVQLLFICSSEKKKCSDIVKKMENQNVLIVGDTPGFAQLGVHFNFYPKPNNTIHFEVNPAALKKARLKADLQLINIGKVINENN